MESNDSYPVFHTRLCKTLRRRFTAPDGTAAGWLIATSDTFTEVPADLAANRPDDPPQLAIPHPR